MSRIEWVFKELKNKRAAFIPLSLRDPDLRTTEAFVLRMAEVVQISSSWGSVFRSHADGPTIQTRLPAGIEKWRQLSKKYFVMTERLRNLHPSGPHDLF
jgi:hypothetical protein